MPKIELFLDQIPLHSPFRVEHPTTPLVVIRGCNDIQAFVDRCPHAQWPLSEGELKDGLLQCIGHGWEFDVLTGQCLTVPACSLKRLNAIVEGDTLRIEWD
jgi:nitrite reductase/ring-hydroxylating ferredoxin subunit